MELVCIVCPMGCRMTVEGEGKTPAVSGNGCPRGVAFAKAELTCPMRSLSTTVRTQSATMPVLPVRTQSDIPKQLLPAAMQAINKLTLTQPLRCGDIVLENVAGSGVCVIATCYFDG